MGVVHSHLPTFGGDPAKKGLREYYKWHQKYGLDDTTKFKVLLSY